MNPNHAYLKNNNCYKCIYFLIFHDVTYLPESRIDRNNDGKRGVNRMTAESDKGMKKW